MDKKKKKAKRKAKGAANAAEPPVVDHSQGPHRSSEIAPSLVAEQHEVLSASVPGSVPLEMLETELRREESDHSGPAPRAVTPWDTEESQSLELFDRCHLDGRPDNANNFVTSDFSCGENLNGELYDSCTNEEHVERAQMQALIIQMTQMQALAQEKEQIVRELEELQDALSIERETAELLRDQMTYLQGHIAERDVLEMGTHTEIQRLNAENVALQGLIAELTQKVKRLEEDLERLEEERGKVEQESRQIISRKEKEGGEMVAELKKRVEKLEQEREDLEEEQMKLKQESRQMILKVEQEGEKMEQLTRQMTAKMETERENLEQEIRQMTVQMEEEQEKLEKERQQMRTKLEQERVKFDQENKLKIANLTQEGVRLEKENRQLVLKMEQEREAFHQERNQMKSILAQEREMLELERHPMAEKLAREREQMEQEYGQVIAKMELDREVLEHDRRQITAKMTALETGLEQLEREASVRARVFKDLSTATDVDSSKKWDSWRVYGKDPLAEAIAVAEEARMQRMAIAQTVDKLLAENVQLMSKVNEQASVINDLTKRISLDKGSNKITYAEEEKVDVTQETCWVPDTEAETRDSTETSSRVYSTKNDDFGHPGGNIDADKVKGINGYIALRTIDESLEVSTIRHNGVNSAAESSKSNLIPDSSAAIAGNLPYEESGSSESLTTSFELTERRDSSRSANLIRTHEEHSTLASRATEMNNSLIKAPIRFWSFVTGYISGADLVKN